MKYRVHVTDTGSLVTIEADEIGLYAGGLALRDASNELVMAFAPGQWKQCWAVTAEKDHPGLATTQVRIDDPHHHPDDGSLVNIKYTWRGRTRMALFANELRVGWVIELTGAPPERTIWRSCTVDEADEADFPSLDDARSYLMKWISDRLEGKVWS